MPAWVSRSVIPMGLSGPQFAIVAARCGTGLREVCRKMSSNPRVPYSILVVDSSWDIRSPPVPVRLILNLHDVVSSLCPVGEFGGSGFVGEQEQGGLRGAPCAGVAVGRGDQVVAEDGSERPVGKFEEFDSSSTVSPEVRRLKSNAINNLGVVQSDHSLECSGKL